MEWIQNKTIYHTIEEAILGMSGQSAEEQLSPREVPAEQVCGIKQAGETIEECIRKNMPVVIVGDYDADGITSTTILTRLLYSMGVKVRPIIPRRFTDGYGVSDSILEGVEKSLIITVDNGISAGDVLDKAATEHGNTVVVLDHHLADGREPKHAAVTCDPHMDGDSSPYKEYCGAGLAFKLAQYMLRVADISAMPDDLLVLACIGTIADSMPLTGDNRAIVMNGLRRVNSGEAHLPAGINQLLWTASSGAPMNEETIAYTVAPLINAPGRMYNAGGTSVLKALLCTERWLPLTTTGKRLLRSGWAKSAPRLTRRRSCPRHSLHSQRKCRRASLVWLLASWQISIMFQPLFWSKRKMALQKGRGGPTEILT